MDYFRAIHRTIVTGFFVAVAGCPASQSNSFLTDVVRQDDTSNVVIDGSVTEDTVAVEEDTGSKPDSEPVRDLQVFPPGSACIPGSSHECFPGDPSRVGVGVCHTGIQVCPGDGEFGQWSDCLDAVAPGEEQCDDLDHDCDGVAANGTQCVCVPGSSQQCYSGPANTEGVGICRSGAQMCDGFGSGFGVCENEVLPRQEICNQLDDDCNGVVDDGVSCLCTPNQRRLCYSGPAGTAGVGPCRQGLQQCDSSGQFWGACTNEIVPQTELCNNIDDNCDGTVDNGGMCVCRLGQTQSCYAGPSGTQGVGICRAGTQFCDITGTRWLSCTGQVLPRTEVCFNDLDDDCNGAIDEGCPICDPTAVVYANTSGALYAIDPDTYTVRHIADFSWPSDGYSHQMTDLAAQDSGALYGVTFDALYRVNRSTAECTLVAPLASGEMFNALTFLPSETVGGPERLVAATTSGQFVEINLSTGRSTLIGNFGMSAGADGDIVAVAGAGTFASVDVASVGRLARLNPATGAVTSLTGATGVTNTWGLGYWRGRLFGFLEGGAIVTIDPTTGRATQVASTPNQAWWGAAVTTCAPVN